MGWGSCGEDSKGRPIGYCHAARCDHPGCRAKIDRGLAYACGGMHGTGTISRDDNFNDYACEGYFCSKHRTTPTLEHEDGKEYPVDVEFCLSCAAELEKDYRTSDEWREHWPTDAPVYVGEIPGGASGTARKAPSAASSGAATRRTASAPHSERGAAAAPLPDAR
jgi:hypothetical protein